MSRPLLLVVEDEPDFRTQIAADLGDEFELVFATCQVEAFKRLAEQSWDGVLLDLHLPVGPTDLAKSIAVGEEIVKQARAKRTTARDSIVPLPIVVMTAHATKGEDARRLLKELGATDYIPKAPPWTKEQLRSLVRGALRGEGAQVPVTLQALQIRLAFDLERKRVWVEELKPPLGGDRFALLACLRAPFVDEARRMEGIRANVLAAQLETNVEALRKRIERLRDSLCKRFETKLGRAIGEQDIIENPAKWQGYRLNPGRVVLVDPPQEPRKRPLPRPGARKSPN